MANIKISQLTSLSTMTDAAIIPVVASGVTQQISGANLKNYFTGSYGNANVVANLAALGSNPITTTGNITAGNLDAVNLVINRISSDDSSFVTIEDGVNVSGDIAATGNITGGAISFAGGSRLSPLGANLDIFAGTGAYVNLTTSDESSRMGVDNGGGYIVTAGGTWGFGTTGNLTAPGNISATGTVLGNSVTLNTSANVSVAAGQMAWNSADGTMDIGLGYGNVVLQTGQETHYVVRNETGTAISNGTAVYCSGVTSSGRMSVDLMTSNIDPVQFLGLATQDISNGVNGIVTWFGYVRDLDTRGTANTAISVGDETWAAGDKLYVHPTAAGKLTKVEPAAPNVKICVASIITRNQNSGVLFVRPTTNLTAADLSDVQITTPATNQFLVYVGNRWENTALDISLDTTPALGGNLAGAGFNISNVGNITGGNISVTGNITGNTAGFAIGYRDIPQVSLASNVTTALTDAGKHYYSTSASNLSLTIADNSVASWPVGTAISVVNRGTANITVAPAAGVSLYLAGNATSGNRTVTTYGMATMMNVAANIWMISGTVV
jgi:hypothetical protein